MLNQYLHYIYVPSTDRGRDQAWMVFVVDIDLNSGFQMFDYLFCISIATRNENRMKIGIEFWDKFSE